ncbi:twin-arginine translocation signal domain-containing protein, partial [Burkholderia pseudomallei]|uniref:twin-arginine translocation signal domain-containing protein n=1 Tax=Burkholderia pseudomallei TaxID=28450 RepID=UPI001177D8F3
MTTDLDLPDAVRASRRTFLKAAGAAAAVGLTIGFEWLDASRPALGATAPAAPAGHAARAIRAARPPPGRRGRNDDR